MRSVVFDCPDPVRLASFYAALLGGQPDVSDDAWCEVHAPGWTYKLAFQRVDRYTPPEWPDGRPQQIHLDLSVTDLASASRLAVSLGAVVLGDRVDEPHCVFVVHADPAGHPFCLCEERQPST